MAILQAEFLKDRSYKAVSLTHFFVDILNNGRALLVALLAVSIGLSNAQVGVVVLLYNIGSSLSQPVFGILADRRGPRRLIIGGLAWMIGMYSIAAITEGWWALIPLTLAGIGSGAVHPAGTKIAGETSEKSRTQATGVFFASGQTGLFVGPALTGLLLTLFGQQGFLVLTGLASGALYYAWISVKNSLPGQVAGQSVAGEPNRATTQPTGQAGVAGAVQRGLATLRSAAGQAPWDIVLPLTLIIICNSTVGITIINYAPKLFTEMDYQPWYVGLVTGLFMLGSAAGGIVGGVIADKHGRRLAIRIGLALSIVPIFFYIPIGDPWRFPLLLLAGFFSGMPHSVLVIMAQALLPGRRGFASGLILGLMFFSGALGSFFLGWVADKIGLAISLQGLILVPIVAGLTTLFLPAKEEFGSRGGESG